MRSTPDPAASPADAVAVVDAVEVFDRLVLGARRPVVVDFSADWCGPSRALVAQFEALARQYAGAVDFVRVDTEAAPELVRREAVAQVPTLRGYFEGRVVSALVGVGPGLEVDRMARRLARRGRLGDLIARWWPRPGGPTERQA